MKAENVIVGGGRGGSEDVRVWVKMSLGWSEYMLEWVGVRM